MTSYNQNPVQAPYNNNKQVLTSKGVIAHRSAQSIMNELGSQRSYDIESYEVEVDDDEESELERSELLS